MSGQFVSYAQHGEDVILWRALGGRTGVFYVDVGAFDPTYDSVTRSLYERGWRGINIEAQPDRIRAFEEERPEDINIAVAIGDRDGAITLTVPTNPGWASTLDAGSTGADASRSRLLEVPLRRLSTVLTEHSINRVDVLKVDVEGGEPAVVRGLLAGLVRPTVCVVEGMAPGLGRAAGDEAVQLLLDAGYTHCMFDGLNHYLTTDDDLVEALSVPANPIDEYLPYALVSTIETAERLARERTEHTTTIAALVAENIELRAALAGHDPRHLGARDITWGTGPAAPTRAKAPRADTPTVGAAPVLPADERTRTGQGNDAMSTSAATALVADPDVRRARRRAMFVRLLQGGVSSLQPGRVVGVPRLGPALDRVAPSEAVTLLYRIIFGRNPDPEGLAEWAGHVEAGFPLLHVARHFAVSDEAAIQPAANQERVRAELRRWSNIVAADELGVSDARLHVYTPGLVAQEIFIHALYEVALQRRATPEELALQGRVIARGASREAMVRGFAAHPDARARLLGRPGFGLRGRVRMLRDRWTYPSTFRSLVGAAEQRRIGDVVRDFSLAEAPTPPPSTPSEVR